MGDARDQSDQPLLREPETNQRPGWSLDAAGFQLLSQRLDDLEHLPQRDAHRKAFGPELAYGRHFGPPSPDAKPAAVMIMLARGQGARWEIPLTVRPDSLPDHPGQISLPGGRVEKGETYLQAAQREFCEELGVPEFPGTILGGLRPIYVFNSNYRVAPFVAYCDVSLSYQPCPVEVARVLPLPVDHMLAPTNRVTRAFKRGKVEWTAPGIRLGSDFVWGATALILADLLPLLE